MRRPLFVILVTAILLSQFGATALVLVSHRQARRHVAELTVRWFEEEGETLTHLIIPNPALAAASQTFERLGRGEIRYQGRLYDVVSEEAQGDTLHLWAWWDRHEEAAVQRLATLVDRSSSESGTIAPSPVKSLVLLYLPPASKPRVRLVREASRLGLAPDLAPSAHTSDVPHPPPEA